MERAEGNFRRETNIGQENKVKRAIRPDAKVILPGKPENHSLKTTRKERSAFSRLEKDTD